MEQIRLKLDILRNARSDDKGQDIAEYAVMLAVILVLVVGQRKHRVLASCQFDSMIQTGEGAIRITQRVVFLRAGETSQRVEFTPSERRRELT